MATVPMTTLLSVDPNTAVRVQRVELALTLLGRDHSELETRKSIEAEFGVSRVTAWRDVEMAKDMSL